LGILQRAARPPGKQRVDEDQTTLVGLVDLGEQIIDVGGWLSHLAARPTPVPVPG
jgi:Iap family predicted aminopeptidase